MPLVINALGQTDRQTDRQTDTHTHTHTRMPVSATIYKKPDELALLV